MDALADFTCSSRCRQYVRNTQISSLGRKEALRGADVKLAGPGTSGYALHVLGRLARQHIPSRNPFDEFVSGVNVVDQDSHAAIFHIVADAWNGNVEQMLFSIGARSCRVQKESSERAETTSK